MMSSTPRERAWLPEQAVVDWLTASPLTALVDDWSSQWFMTGRSHVGAWEVIAPGALETGITATAEGLALSCGPCVPDRLQALVFGMPPTARPTPADGRQMTEVVRSCLEDLKRRLTQLYGLSSDARWQDVGVMPLALPGRRCAVSLGGSARDGEIGIVLDDELAVRCIKARLPPATAGKALRPRQRTLADLSVELSALVGTCRLGLSQMAGCAVGDVLVLDRPLDESLELAVDSHIVSDCDCRLVDHGDALRLVLGDIHG